MKVKEIAKTILCRTGNEGEKKEKKKRERSLACEEDRPGQMLNY